MQITRLTSWTATLLLLACSVYAFAQGAKDKAKSSGGGAEQSITKMEKQLVDGVVKADTATVGNYLADNYVRVFPDGHVGGRQDTLDALKNGTAKYSSIDESDKEVKVSGNVAIVTFKAAVKGTSNGQPADGNYRGLRTWVNEGGHWKVVAFSTTRIAGGK